MKYLVKTQADKAPIGKSAIYLGTWCFDKPCLGISPEHNVLPFIWNDKERYNREGISLDERSTRLFDDFVKIMNEIHCENLPKRYWGILTQMWFMDYLQTFYDRYRTIYQLIGQSESFQYRCLQAEKFRTPNGMAESIDELSNGHLFNEQIYSQILNDNYLKKIKFTGNNSVSPITDKTELINKIFLGSLYQGLPEDIVAINSGLNDLGEIIQFNNKLEKSYNSNTLTSRRLIFDEFRNENGDDFERIFFRSLVLNTPKLLIEGLSDMRKLLIHKCSVPKLFVTTNDHGNNSLFLAKLMMAESVRAGGKIIWGQHGPNYKVFNLELAKRFEYENPDKFYCWGWAGNKQKKFKNMPSLNISGLSSRTNTNNKTGPILFISSGGPKYTFNFRPHPISTEFIEYSKIQVDFIKALDKKIRDKMYYRPYFHDNGQGIEENIYNNYPTIKIIKGGDIIQQLNQFRLVVIDRPDCSSFGNLLGINKPFVIVFKKEYFKYNKKSEPIFEKMLKSGIIQYNTTSAAQFVNKIYENPSKWWDSQEVQSAKNMFIKNYANYNKDFVKMWTNEILDEYYNN